MKAHRQFTTDEVDGMQMYWQTGGPLDGYPMAVVIEIDELADACRQYLRTRGAPEYGSIEEARAAREAS